MSNYTLIAFDMDGTLLNSKKEISPATAKAISDARKAGKCVAICTGRGMAEINEYLPQLGDVHYIIAVSGALIYDNYLKKVIHTSPLSIETVQQVLEIARGDDIMVHLLMDEISVSSTYWVENIARYSMGQYKPLFERVAVKPENIFDYYAANPVTVPKVNLYHSSPEMRDKSRAIAQKMGIKAEIINAEVASLEFTPCGVSKGTGIAYVCSLLGVGTDAAIAVGDSENDIPMFEAAGLSIAVGNASKPAMAAADAVVADCDSDGCAQAIYEYLL